MPFSVLPLNFTTFYLCGIKPFTKISQRICVNLLLKDVHPTSSNTYEVLSDSVCSNYVKGKKPIKDELWVDLLKLSTYDLKNRIDNIGIQEPMLAAAALHKLIEASSLQKKTKDSLLASSNSDDPQIFIAKVFSQAIRAKDVRPLSREEETFIESCAHVADIPANDADSTREAAPYIMAQSPMPGAAFNGISETQEEENGSWTMDYVPPTFSDDPLSFAMNPVHISMIPVNMPMDYRALVYSLKRTLNENPLQSFSFPEFIESMSIDDRSGYVTQGSIRYWNIRGSFRSICSAIGDIGFSTVSDFAIQVIGQYNLKNIEELTETLKRASNEKVNILTALIYVREASELELRIIAHVCPEKVGIQKEDIRIYQRHKQ